MVCGLHHSSSFHLGHKCKHPTHARGKRKRTSEALTECEHQDDEEHNRDSQSDYATHNAKETKKLTAHRFGYAVHYQIYLIPTFKGLNKVLRSRFH